MFHRPSGKPERPVAHCGGAFAFRWVAGVTLAVAAAACRTAAPRVYDDSPVVLAHAGLDAPDPSRPGPFAVRHLFYGSGNDYRRAVYRDSVAIRTPLVDASKLLTQVPAKLQRSRQKYWKFDFRHLPLNARVWYPDGPGPFPLVLIVHGNHDMKQYSDPGYAYLGALLASRGYIVASVDENFLNGSIHNENDARGWLLLEHLAQWSAWNAAPGNPFHGKVDLDRIALIGHSRGGEAVAVAAVFNRLTHFPEDANVRFAFGFHIRAVIAIAPVDGQYQPAGRLTPMENVDYFVLHGTHDGDVSSFVGMRAWQRVAFTDHEPHFKAALFIWRANHGQFNTVWGNDDWHDRDSWLIDKGILLTGDQQRQVAKVFLSAFLDASLRGRRDYVPMFRDYRLAAPWIPKTMYVSRFEDPTTRVVADYEEDVDVTTASAAGATIDAHDLAVWKEGPLNLRWSGTRQNNDAVWLGWNRRRDGAVDTTRAAPSYTITLPDTLTTRWGATGGADLVMSLADLAEVPAPQREPGDSAASPAASNATTTGRQAAAPVDTLPIDATIELTATDGTRAAVALSRFGVVRRPITVRILRWWWLDRRLYGTPREIVLQTFTIPLSAFAAANPRFDPARIRSVTLRFDRSPAGTIVLDDVGFDVMPGGVAP